MPEIRTAVRTGDTLMPARAGDAAAAAAHPGHDARVAVHPAHGRAQPRDPARVSTRSSSTRSTRWPTTSAARIWRCRSSGSTRLSQARIARHRASGSSADASKPIETVVDPEAHRVVAEFLSGHGRPLPTIVQVSPATRSSISAIEVPVERARPGRLERAVGRDLRRHRRRWCASIARRWSSSTRAGSPSASRIISPSASAPTPSPRTTAASRARLRLDAERRLKAGELQALVATASLELGIDIGSVDLVCQIGSPRSIAVAVQRIGRAGHWRGAVPKGRLFATTRDELVECAALVLAMRRGELDRLIVPDAPLDILAQQIVAMCAAEDWRRRRAVRHASRRAYPYRDLPRAEFDEIVDDAVRRASPARARAATARTCIATA